MQPDTTDRASEIDWGRVLRYTGLTVLATGVAGFFCGAIRGIYKASDAIPPDWTYLLQAVLVPAALFLVFVRLARVQRDRTREHAAFVLGGALVFSLLNLFVGQSATEFFLSALFAMIVASLGVEVGQRMGPKQGIVTEDAA